MHPLHHAKSSAARLGGDPNDYLPIHAWMDESKQAFSSPMHRAYRHHMQVLPELERVFGTHIKGEKGQPGISMKRILEDHLTEDCKGTTPNIEDWLMQLMPRRWMRKNTEITTEQNAQIMAERFGGEAQEYLDICEFMDEGRSRPEIADWRYRAWRWHGFATFDAERKFGVSFKNSAGRTVIVRYVAEKHIVSALGFLPSMQDWYTKMRFMPFMAGNHVIAGTKILVVEQ